MAEPGPALVVDVVSDVMCPWCFIGKRRLERALAARDEGPPVEVRWRPFQLDPTIPEGGMDRQAYLERKFGAGQADAIYDRVREAGATEDIAFAFEKIARSPNTLNAHRLIRWAGDAGRQDELVERLFALYFLEGADLSDDAVLVEAAGAAGLDAERIAEALASDADAETVREEIAQAQRMGVTGVPCFIVDGRYAVMGAQPPETIAEALSRAEADRAKA